MSVFRALKIQAAGLCVLAALASANETCAITLAMSASQATCQDKIGLCVSNAYALPTPPFAANGAVFMDLANKSEGTITILGAKSSASEAVEFHTTEHEDGMMKMLQLPSLSLSPKQSESLKPKAKHIMLIGLKKPLRVGESLTLTLQVKNSAKKQNAEQSLTLTIPISQAQDCSESSLDSESSHAHHH